MSNDGTGKHPLDGERRHCTCPWCVRSRLRKRSDLNGVLAEHQGTDPVARVDRARTGSEDPRPASAPEANDREDSQEHNQSGEIPAGIKACPCGRWIPDGHPIPDECR